MRRTLTTLTLSLIVAVIAVSNVTAELATEQEMRNVADNWVTDIVYKTGDWGGKTNPIILSSFEVRSDDGLLMARIYNIDPKGYIAVPILKEMPPVKMYSDKSNLDESQTGGALQLLKDVLLSRLEAYEAIYGSLDVIQPASGVVMFGPSHKVAWNRLAVAVKDFSVNKSTGILDAGELPLESNWHQSEPYYDDCPSYEGDQCVVGCVATAMAQIMRYWEWPLSGVGQYSYTWDRTSVRDPEDVTKCIMVAKTPEELIVDLSDPYDWSNMPDECGWLGCNSAEKDALAELNYEVGVTLEMMYGAECGSGVWTSQVRALVPSALQNQFRYKNTIHVEFRKNYTQQEWFDLIKQEIDADRPMEYCILKHAIVCDGYRENGDQLEYHMNYGGSGTNTDTWYVLDSLRCHYPELEPDYICPFENEFLIAGIEPEYDITTPHCVSYSVGSTPSTDIDVVFSEDMDQSTLNNSNISVVGSISGSHSSSFPFVPETSTLTINPDVNFDYDETVTVTISTGVTDLAGNPLESECSFNFEIGSCTWFVVTPWAGANGSISPDSVLIVCQGDDVEFTATPASPAYEVDRWFENGIEKQIGETNYTVDDIQSSVGVVVWFKTKPELSGITVLSPNGGETFCIEGKLIVTWDWTGDIGIVIIELLNNGDPEIVDTVTNDSSHIFWLPYYIPIGSSYKVRVSSANNSNISDESDNFFEIVDIPDPPPIIEIYTIQDLQNICSDGMHPPDGHYVIMNDINADGFPFQPIGTTMDNYFCGILDGAGHCIRRLEIIKPDGEYVGLFSILDNPGTVKNLCFTEELDVVGDKYVGVIAGWSSGNIIDCSLNSFSRGCRIEGRTRVGGIVGDTRGTISNCIINSSSTNDISIDISSEPGGGIAGVNGEGGGNIGVIENCFVKCYIDGEEDECGGIVGRNFDVVHGCAFEGEIDADDYLGGIIGWNYGGTIENCYYTGVKIRGDNQIGGICGYNDGGNIDKCYAAGVLIGNRGGIVGRNYGSITNCFYDTNITNTSNSYVDGNNPGDGAIGLSTTEMQQLITYTTQYSAYWDFNNIWAMNNGVDYPRLRGIGDSLSAPDNVVASSDQSDGVHVSWDPVSFDAGGGSYSALYRVYRSDSPGANPPETEVTGWREENTLVDSTAVPEATYYYWVQAAAGMNGVRASELGGPAQGQRTYPQADTPTGILASDSHPHSILIEWDEATVANFYRVYRSISIGGSNPPLGSWQTELSYVDIPPHPDTIYYYWVRAAMDDTGGGVSEYGGPDSGYYIEPDDIAPTVSILIVPAYPIETQSCTLHVSAEDNEALGYVALHWCANGVQDSAIWDNIGAQTLDTSHIIGAFSANDIIECWARALDVSDNPVESQHLTKIILLENVSQPSHPTGPVCLKTNQLGEYETGGAVTNLGSLVEYRFAWGDGDTTVWSDDTIASKAWTSDGAYSVKSQARSATNTNCESVWSVSLFVVVDSRPPEVVIRTYDKTIVDTVYNTESVTISGDSRDDEPSSGLASTEINTGAENKGDEYNWSFDVSLDEGSNTFVITSTDNAGNVGAGTLNLILVGVDDLDEAALPDRFALNQNYPNPFNPATVIEFDLPRRSNVSITIFNLLGQKVVELVDEEYPAGSHQITWDGISSSGQRASTGIYFYRLVAEDFINTKKMILLK